MSGFPLVSNSTDFEMVMAHLMLISRGMGLCHSIIVSYRMALSHLMTVDPTTGIRREDNSRI